MIFLMKKGIGKNENAFKQLSNALKRFADAFERVCVFSLFPLFIRKVTFREGFGLGRIFSRICVA